MKKELNVKGMHCKSCEMLISDSLGDEPGVKTVTVAHKAGKVSVEFDEKKVTLDKIKDLIKKEGYEVA